MQTIRYFDYYLQLEKANRNALAIFSSQRCGACRNLLRYVAENPPLKDIFVIDAEQAPGLIEEFSIFQLPTLFLYKDGYFHASLSNSTIYTLATNIEQALSSPPEEQP